MHFRKLAQKLACTAAAAAVLVTTVFAAAGTVDAGGSRLNLRSQCNTSSQILAKIPDGSQIEVIAVAEDAGWYQVSYNGITGYVSGDYVVLNDGATASAPASGTVTATPAVPPDPAPAQTPAAPAASTSVPESGYVKVTCSVLNIREGAGTDTRVVGSLYAGNIVKVIDALPGWYRTERGYISADYAEPSGAPAAEPAAASSSGASKGEQVARMAWQYIGYPYVYAGSSPAGFDCSGFTSYLYRQFGVNLSRSPAGQLTQGTTVSRDSLRPGDILVFSNGSNSNPSHVGLYVGDGKFVHASTPATGVKVNSLTDYNYPQRLISCRRIFN